MSATIFTFITHNQNYHHVCVWGFWWRRVACGDYSTNYCSSVTNEHGEKLHHRAMATYSKGVYIPISKYIERTDYLFRGTRRCKKKGPLTFIHSLLAADTQHKRWMNWTGSRCWSSATSYTQAWMMVGSVSCGERDISKSIRSFFFVSSDENYCRVLPDD